MNESAGWYKVIQETEGRKKYCTPATATSTACSKPCFKIMVGETVAQQAIRRERPGANHVPVYRLECHLPSHTNIHFHINFNLSDELGQFKLSLETH